MPKNIIWSMDLTMIDRQQVFGVIDSGTRGLVFLEKLKDKSSLSILKALITSIEKFGKPKSLRSDNEIVFTSKLFKLALFILGIKQQTSDIASPWQNGRIERLFGTLKSSIKDLVFPNVESLEVALVEFKFFYNFVRPHQHLYGKTPSEAWDGKEKVTKESAKEVYYFNGLAGNIGGFYFME
jgi:transposase InsO family protein